jgi:hypothetical protein
VRSASTSRIVWQERVRGLDTSRAAEEFRVFGRVIASVDVMTL